MNFKSLQKDSILLAGLLIISFVSVYFMPMTINRIIFLFFLFGAYSTKLDYVYLVWFFIINDAPSRLFSGGGGTTPVRIPLYPVVPDISIDFQDLFIILFIVKFIITKRNLKFIFKKEFYYFFLLGGIVLVYSLFMGMSFNSIILTVRRLAVWAFVFIVPFYIYNKHILERVSLFLFPVVFFAFASQIFTYFTGSYLEYILRGIEQNVLKVDESGIASRSYSSMYITFFVIVQAMYFYYSRATKIKQNYLLAVIITGFLAIFLSAARGWILAMGVFLISVIGIFIYEKGFTKILRISLLAALILFLVAPQVPLVQKQLKSSYSRLKTVIYLAEGDITAGGTLSRLDIRSPRVMKQFRESPVFGWGFSDEYYKYEDAHVGNQNLLMNLGILGFIFVNVIYIALISRIFKMSRKYQTHKHDRISSLIYVVGLISIFIIHSSSTQFWGYIMHFGQMPKILVFAFLFTAVNVVFLNYRNENNGNIVPMEK